MEEVKPRAELSKAKPRRIGKLEPRGTTRHAASDSKRGTRHGTRGTARTTLVDGRLVVVAGGVDLWLQMGWDGAV